MQVGDFPATLSRACACGPPLQPTLPADEPMPMSERAPLTEVSRVAFPLSAPIPLPPSPVELEEGLTFVPASTVLEPPEVLAPAGGRAQFLAALNAGADAVYLGLKSFNARARAENFTLEELAELVPLAHRYGMKVLVTVNVLIKQLELEELLHTLAELEALRVDALIVQDVAVVRLVRAYFPGLRLHASTQLAVHNLLGVLQAASYGFKRVVLARELTAKDLQALQQALPPGLVELEAFCHGSLCYSYSGLCFFSGANDARSGNRGECAYTCRQPYKIVSEPGHGFLFSMRDLDTSQDLALLVNTGVQSLKIEGRKKDAQYVSTAVRLYRQRLDEVFGRSTLRPEAPPEARRLPEGNLQQDLRLSFHRDSTGFFLKGRYVENVIDLDNPTHQGLKVGTVQRVKGRWIALTTERPLERFDGLRILPPERGFHALPQHGQALSGSQARLEEKYHNEVIQFSLRELKVEGRRQPTAPAGSRIELELPAEVPLPRVGDQVFQWRSAELKRRVEALSVAPADARVRPMRPLEVLVRASRSMGVDELGQPSPLLLLEAETRLFDQVLTQERLSVPWVLARKETLPTDLLSLLQQFGEEGFETQRLRLDPPLSDTLVDEAQTHDPSPWQVFVPRARLKALKQGLAEGLSARWRALVNQRAAQARAGLLPLRRREAVAFQARRFVVKLDRLENLAMLEHFMAEQPSFRLDELIFEPKRMFLADTQAEQLLTSLEGFSQRQGVPVRMAFPLVLRRWDEAPLKKWLRAFVQRGGRRLEVGNLGALEAVQQWGLAEAAGEARLDLSGDFTLYALNAEASAFWQAQGLSRLTLSLEDDLENMTAQLSRWPEADDGSCVPQVLLYKDTPLFIAEACSLTALHNGCPTSKVCGYRTLEIENPAGERFYVAHEQCKSIVYAHEPFCLTGQQEKLLKLGIVYFRLDFLTRPYDEPSLKRVLRAALRGERLSESHTANFERRLL